MSRMTMTIDAPGLVLDLIRAAIEESEVLVLTSAADAAALGWKVNVTEMGAVTEPPIEHTLIDEFPDLRYGSYDLDVLAATVYKTRSGSPRDITPEQWEDKKRRFPGSVRSCYDDVLDMIENGELDDD